MTNVNTNIMGTDSWRGVAFPLDKFGIPTPPGTVAWEGNEIVGVQDFTPAFPKLRSLAGVAQGRVIDTLAMPPNTVFTGTMKSLYHSQALESTLDGLIVNELLGKSILARFTDRQGLEPNIMLMIQQLITHGDDFNPVWYTLIFPHVRMKAQQMPFNAQVGAVTYDYVVSPSKVHSYGLPYTMVADGCLSSCYDDIISEGLLNLFFVQADGYTTQFNLPSDKLSGSSYATTMGMFDFTTGAIVTGTPSASKFTAGVAPAATDICAILYEMS